MITNVAFSLLNFLLSYVVAFFLSPYIFHQLGDTRYGVWALFGELMSYYGLLDLGVRTALNYYLGGATANERREEMARYASSAFALLAVTMTATFVVTAGVVFFFRQALTPAGAAQAEVVAGATLFLVFFCVGMIFEVHASVVIAERRLDLVNGADMAGKLVSTSLMCLALYLAPGIVTLCLAQLTGRALYWGLNAYFAHKYAPPGWLSFSRVDWNGIRELVGYGSRNAFINISTLLINRKDVSFITIFLGAALVPNYSFVRMLVQSVNDIGAVLTQSLRPTVIYHWARDEAERAYTIYYESARYSSFVMWVAVAGLFVVGRDFLSLWIGERFITGSLLYRSDIILGILLIGNMPRMMHSMSRQVLFATNKHQPLARQMVGEAIANVTLALLLIRPFGLVGLAIASAVPMLISDGLALTRTMQRSAGVSLRRLLFRSVAPSLFTALGVYGVGVVYRQWIPIHSWMTLLAVAGLMGITAAVMGYLFVLSSEARSWVWTLGPRVWMRLKGRTVAA